MAGKAKQKALISRQLKALIMELPYYKIAHVSHGGHCPVVAFNALLLSCFPLHVNMFNQFWSPKAMLLNCDYVVDKAFCRAVLAASKWLQQERFPHDIYDPWPPSPPADFT